MVAKEKALVRPKSKPVKDIKKEMAKMGYTPQEVKGTMLPEEITIGSESDGSFEAVSVKKERVERSQDRRKTTAKTPEGVP